jgi:membrane protease YdiL (CAAX protease family)
MLGLVLVLLLPTVLWLGQTLLLYRAGLPIRWRLDWRDLPAAHQAAQRLLANVAFVAVLAGYPLLRGQSPVAYYAQLLPPGPPVKGFITGVAAAVVYLTLLYAAWAASGAASFAMRHDWRHLLLRLAGVPFTAVFAAGVEELLFRGVLLANLLEELPPVLAVALGSVVFAGAHYVRRVKRYWTFPGHLLLGVLLCVSFVWSGSLWLPFGLHAGGILVLLAVRPFLRSEGPAWLVGASIFPYAGALGLIGLVLLTLNIWIRYGPGS